MKFTVNPECCTGHGRCYTLAPSVFEADDDGYGSSRYTDKDVPADLLAEAELGRASCPELAIDASD